VSGQHIDHLGARGYQIDQLAMVNNPQE
jgi:hypothetical protein